jgi:hypothetical protein
VTRKERDSNAASSAAPQLKPLHRGQARTRLPGLGSAELGVEIAARPFATPFKLEQ